MTRKKIIYVLPNAFLNWHFYMHIQFHRSHTTQSWCSYCKLRVLLRVLCYYCDRSYLACSSCWVSSTVLQLAVATAVLCYTRPTLPVRKNLDVYKQKYEQENKHTNKQSIRQLIKGHHIRFPGGGSFVMVEFFFFFAKWGGIFVSPSWGFLFLKISTKFFTEEKGEFFPTSWRGQFFFILMARVFFFQKTSYPLPQILIGHLTNWLIK